MASIIRSIGSYKVAFPLVVLLLVIGTRLLMLSSYLPSPDDELFYIEAAWKLVHGEYHPPNSSAPFHHLLRWAVLLPGTVIFGLFGASHLSYALAALSGIVLSSIALFVLLRRGNVTMLPAMAGALVVFLQPILATRFLSEPFQIFWVLVSLNLAGYQKSVSVSRLIASGVAFALAVNATLASVFYFLTPVTFAYFTGFKRAPDYLSRTIRCAALIGIGAAIATSVISLGEFVSFGDPFLQYKLIMQWHIPSLAKQIHWMNYLTTIPSDNNCIIGFSAGLFRRSYPLSLFCVVSIFAAWTATIRRCVSTERLYTIQGLIASALISLLVLEVLGPLALDKFYGRFANCVFVLIAASAVALSAELLLGQGRGPRFFGAMSFCLIGFPLFESMVATVPQRCEVPYAGIIGDISNDLVHVQQLRRKPKQIRLVDLHGDLPALVPLATAIGPYSFFRAQSSDLTASLPDCGSHGRVYVMHNPQASSLPTPGQGRFEALSKSCPKDPSTAYLWKRRVAPASRPQTPSPF